MLQVDGTVRRQFVVIGVDDQRSKHLRRWKNVVRGDRKDNDSVGTSGIVDPEEVASFHGQPVAQRHLVISDRRRGNRYPVLKYEDAVVQLTPDADVEMAVRWAAEVGDAGQETVAREAIVQH